MRERDPRLREDDEKRRGDDEKSRRDDEKRRGDDERNRGDDNQQDTRTRRLQAGGQLPKASVATDRLRAGMTEPSSWNFSPHIPPPSNQSVIPFGHYFCNFIPAGLEF